MLESIDTKTGKRKQYRTRRTPKDAQTGDVIATCSCGGDIVQLSEQGGLLAFGLCTHCGETDLFEGQEGALQSVLSGNLRGAAVKAPMPAKAKRIQAQFPELGDASWLYEPLPGEACEQQADRIARKIRKAEKKAKKNAKKLKKLERRA